MTSQPLMTIEEWRDEMRKRINRKFEKPKILFGITESSRKLIMGFDADVSECGLALYDAAEHKVLNNELIPLRLIDDWLGDMIGTYGRERMLARVEITDMATIYGQARSLHKDKRKTPREREQAVFKLAVNSGRCLEIAYQFTHLLRRRSILYEEIPSSDRMNFKNNKALKGKTPKELEDLFRMMFVSSNGRKNSSRIFPSKMSAEGMKHFFPIQTAGEEEMRDALCLAMPEAIFRKVAGKNQFSQKS